MSRSVKMSPLRRSGLPGGTRLGIAAALIAGAVLAPVIIFGSLVRETVDHDIAAREEDQRLLTARLAAASIERALLEAGARLDLIAGRQRLRDGLRRGDGVELQRHVADVARGGPYGSALALDASGRLLARSPASPELIGQSFSDRDYYTGALLSTGPFVSEAYASRAAGSPTFVAVSLAVRDGSETLGIVQLTIPPAQLLMLLEPLRAQDGREILIIDKRGRAVAGTDATYAPLSVVAAPGLDRALAGQTGTATARLEGRERLVTYAHIAAAAWALYVLDDPDLALAAQRRLAGQLGAAGVAVLALGLLGAAGLTWLYGQTARHRDALARSEAALARTNEELEAASRHKSEFLASMSHELRTPLNAILGFSDLLQEQLATVLSERQKRYLRNIRDAGDHLLGLINDVLDLSKVEAGRIELRPELTTLGEVAAPVLASMHAAANARGVAFEADAPRDVAVVLDIARARQILYNLLSNAVKFTPSGGRVELTLAADGAALAITVSDTGIGIPEAARDRVFGTFERLHEGRFDAPGTGLGLALTKRLVELQGGSIEFTSREGAGASFRVRLPDVVAAEAPRERLLVVEDEARDADLIVALAARVGLESEVATSVAGAMAAIRRAPPIAVVVDLRLPDDRGERLLEALKAEPATRDVPVIVVTVEDDEGRSRLLGADDHLTKPIDHQRLSGWLEQVAARRAGRETSLAGAAR